MSDPKLRPHQMPGWPRMLSVELASAYCGLSPNAFRQAVQEGVWPHPINIGRRLLWDRSGLDQAQDRRTSRSNPVTGHPTGDEPRDMLLEKLDAKADKVRRVGKHRSQDA